MENRGAYQKSLESFVQQPRPPQEAAGADNTRVWKLAPSKGAYLWDQFSRHGHIGIGWLPEHDLRKFADLGPLEKALEKEEGEKKPRAAGELECFLHDMKPGHIVVANKGFYEAVGVGVVTGDYEWNPGLAGKTDMEYPHLRSVEWRLAKPVTIKNQFSRWTITAFDDRFEEIKAAYRKAYPDDGDLLAALQSLGKPLTAQPPPPPVGSRLDPNRSLNWIYYGPPGTGKTWPAYRSVLF